MGKKYRSEVDQWLKPDNLMLLEAWARDGDTLETIADKIGITRQSLWNWSKQHEEIADAISTGKEVIDYKVENAILKAALGYKTEEIKVTVGRKLVNGETVELLKETTTREVPPSIPAAVFWLNNRKYEQWKRNRDKVEMVEQEDSNINITIVKGPGVGEEVNQEVHYEGTLSKGKEESEEDAWAGWDGSEE